MSPARDSAEIAHARYAKFIQGIQKKPKRRKNLSSINTIWANKEAIMKDNPSQGLVRAKKRPPVVSVASQVEKLLLQWLNEKENPREVSSQEIREKAKEILRSLQQTNPQETQFQAGRTWFKRFKTRVGICPKGPKVKQENEQPDIKLENENSQMDWMDCDSLALDEEDQNNFHITFSKMKLN